MSNSMILSRRALLAGISAGALMPLTGVGQLSGALAQPVSGGTLKMLLSWEPPTLVALTNVSSLTLSAKVTEGLLWYDLDFNPQPQLATSWSVSEDGLEYAFELRQNVRWHDGKPFTSADVAHSIELLKTVHPRGRSTFANVVEVSTPDEYKAIIRLSKPAPYMIRALAAAESPIVPKHIYEGTDPRENPANVAPIGTGPFKFKEWVRGRHVAYERNPDYWDAPKPYVDQLIAVLIPDPAARSIAFETEELDFGYRWPLSLADIRRLDGSDLLRFEPKGYAYSSNTYCLQFNLNRELTGNLKVRQAIAHALDRDAMARTVYYGYATPNASPIVPGLVDFHDPSPSPYPFDVAAAERLLDEAGYPRGANGERMKLVIDPNPLIEEPRRCAEFIRSALGRVGINVEIRLEDGASFIKRIYTDYDFDIQYGSFSNLFDPTIGVQRLYWSKNIVKGLPFSNSSGYSNPKVDELLEAAQVETNKEKRRELFVAFQKIIKEELPGLDLLAPQFLTIYNKKVHDHTVTIDGIEGNLSDIYIKA